jgi:hypothetical protein
MIITALPKIDVNPASRKRGYKCHMTLPAGLVIGMADSGGNIPLWIHAASAFAAACRSLNRSGYDLSCYQSLFPASPKADWLMRTVSIIS